MASPRKTAAILLYDLGLSTEEQSVLNAAAKVLASRPDDTVTVKPFRRFGFSGAKLFVLRTSDSRPFVLKIDRKTKVKREYEANTRAFRKLQVERPDHVQVDEADCAGLLAALIPKDHRDLAEGAMTLREWMFRPGNDSTVNRLLRQAYRPLDVRYRIEDERIRTWSEEYQRYWSRGQGARHARERILDLMDGKPLSQVSYGGRKFRSPLRSFALLKNKPNNFRIGPVHGDLHPDNVLVDRFKQTHLIDFSWFDETGHWAKDYVLMELSIRFRLFPLIASSADIFALDTLLTTTPQGVQRICTSKRWHERARPVFARLGAAIEGLRQSAAERTSLTPDQWFGEYTKAMFFVLFGLMAYDDYCNHRVLGALSMLGEQATS
jgi:hypothetical protein